MINRELQLEGDDPSRQSGQTQKTRSPHALDGRTKTAVSVDLSLHLLSVEETVDTKSVKHCRPAVIRCEWGA